MTLFSLIAALLLEQWQPLPRDHRLARLFRRYAEVIESHFNAGEARHGAIGWVLAVAPLALLAVAVYWLLADVATPLAWAWNVLVLYLTMGFRQFSHAYGGVQEALRGGDLEAARRLLGEWRGRSANELTPGEAARVAIEEGLLCSHRYVFGVLAWFVVFGAAGAVVYRLAAILNDLWGARADAEFGAFGRFAARAFGLMDWVPLRMTAASFAVVGDFQDAVECWHAQARGWVSPEQGILLASGAGALGVRLGDPLHQYGGVEYRPALGTGEEADADAMQGGIGLVWRALVMWAALILLATLAYWAG